MIKMDSKSSIVFFFLKRKKKSFVERFFKQKAKSSYCQPSSIFMAAPKNRVGSSNYYLNETLTEKIGHNVYVTNLLGHFSQQELWNTCEKYGKMLDVFIAS